MTAELKPLLVGGLARATTRLAYTYDYHYDGIDECLHIPDHIPNWVLENILEHRYRQGEYGGSGLVPYKRLKLVLETLDEYQTVLELIAMPKRPDGTYNRSREACEQLAKEALNYKNLKGKMK
jgi:hypothetical protein